jgi:hypothetical protein
MHTETFSWDCNEIRNDLLTTQLLPLDKLEKQKNPHQSVSPNIANIYENKVSPVIEIEEEKVVSLPDEIRKLSIRAKVRDRTGIAVVRLKWKPLPSESDWRYVDMMLHDGSYCTQIPVLPYGIMYGVEAIDKNGNGSLWPDFRKDIPYRWIEPLHGRIWECSMSAVIDSNFSDMQRYGGMVIGRKAEKFTMLDTATKVKVLKAVENGMFLYIDCQNFEKFDLSWLPGGIRGHNKWYNSFKAVPDHAIFDGIGGTILNNEHIAAGYFEADNGWELLGEPKAIAFRRYGRGAILLSQVQMFDRPIGWLSYGNLKQMEQLFGNIFDLAGSSTKMRPMLVIDEGEGTIMDILSSVGRWGVVCRN